MQDVDKYISTFPKKVQQELTQLRNMVRELAPQAVETMAYGIVGYKLNNKPLIYFGGYKNHIGLYATPSGHAEFVAELAKYKQGRGSVQFPLDQEIPYGLIERIIKFRIAEVQAGR